MKNKMKKENNMKNNIGKLRSIDYKGTIINVTHTGKIFFNGKQVKTRTIGKNKYVYAQVYDTA